MLVSDHKTLTAEQRRFLVWVEEHKWVLINVYEYDAVDTALNNGDMYDSIEFGEALNGIRGKYIDEYLRYRNQRNK